MKPTSQDTQFAARHLKTHTEFQRRIKHLFTQLGFQFYMLRLRRQLRMLNEISQAQIVYNESLSSTSLTIFPWVSCVWFDARSITSKIASAC